MALREAYIGVVVTQIVKVASLKVVSACRLWRALATQQTCFTQTFPIAGTNRIEDTVSPLHGIVCYEKYCFHKE
jgi:hypothetical protein